LPSRPCFLINKIVLKDLGHNLLLPVGRQSAGDQNYDVFVKLVDYSLSKQSASGKLSLLRFSLDPTSKRTPSKL
jgi:hypothetical protein